jgi:C1A family cysteine protease
VKYGWIPDRPDARDLRLSAEMPFPDRLPDSVDLRPGFAQIPVWDQSPLSSCVSHAVCAACQYLEVTDRETVPSRMANYWWARREGGFGVEDAGCQIRDSIKVAARYGMPPESLWPYDPWRQTDEPPAEAREAGARNLMLQYHSVTTAVYSEMEACLAAWGPFAVGLDLRPSFMRTGRDGMVPMQGSHEPVIGGHALLVVGFNRAAGRFILRNSWGAAWGDEGYCYVPYPMMSRARDGWAVTRMVD